MPGVAGLSAQLLLVRRLARPPDQLAGHEHVEQLQGVVGGGDLQPAHRCQQRRDLAAVRVPAQLRGLRRHPVPGQLDHPPRRHRRDVGLTHAQPRDLGNPVQGQHHAPPGRAAHAAAPQVQLRAPPALRNLQDRLQGASLPGSHRRGQGVVQPVLGRLAHGGHQLHQRGHAGQQHLAFPKPRHRGVEQRPGAVPGRPRLIIQPLHQARLSRGERGEAVHPGDLPLMLQPGLVPLGVALHTRRISHPELRCNIVQHRWRHIQRIAEERPHMTDRDQLQREPQPVVITTPLRDKIPGPRRRGRRTAPVPPDPEARPRTGHTPRVAHPSRIWSARAINVRHIHPLAPDFRPLVLMGLDGGDDPQDVLPSRRRTLGRSTFPPGEGDQRSVAASERMGPVVRDPSRLPHRWRRGSRCSRRSRGCRARVQGGSAQPLSLAMILIRSPV